MARTLIEHSPLTGQFVQVDGLHPQHRTTPQLLYEKGADSSLIPRDSQPARLQPVYTSLPEVLTPWGGRQSVRGRRR